MEKNILHPIKSLGTTNNSNAICNQSVQTTMALTKNPQCQNVIVKIDHITITFVWIIYPKSQNTSWEDIFTINPNKSSDSVNDSNINISVNTRANSTAIKSPKKFSHDTSPMDHLQSPVHKPAQLKISRADLTKSVKTSKNSREIKPA